jgi:hypothetical protein
MRVRLPLLAAILLAAGCGGSGTQTHSTPRPAAPPPPTPSRVAHASSGSLRVTLAGVPRSPNVKARSIYRVRATDSSGKPLAGTITVQIVDPLGRAHTVTYDGTRHPISRRRFVGVFHDDIEFPADARGVPLTFRVEVVTSKGRATINYPVTPR